MSPFLTYYECMGTCDFLGHELNAQLCNLIGIAMLFSVVIGALTITMIAIGFYRTIWEVYIEPRILKKVKK